MQKSKLREERLKILESEGMQKYIGEIKSQFLTQERTERRILSTIFCNLKF